MRLEFLLLTLAFITRIFARGIDRMAGAAPDAAPLNAAPLNAALPEPALFKVKTLFASALTASVAIMAISSPAALATPPDYKSLKRDQNTTHTPDENEVMRIWVAYIGQGDGVLIQLPEKYAYDVELVEGEESDTELIDILIDGGSSNSSDAKRMGALLGDIYGLDGQIIEHAVITHHDQDHILGLTKILENENFLVDYIYHNGLASYRPGVKDGPTAQAVRPDAIYSRRRDGQINRWMARLEADGKGLNPEDFVNDIEQLTAGSTAGFFQGPYRGLADEIARNDRNWEVLEFDRVFDGAPFINQRETEIGRPALNDVRFDIIWPENDLQRYNGWSETINGNSVTFQLTYKNFSMLFTGDHNELSEEALTDLEDFKLDDCDVLKVPHHGAGGTHAFQPFFKEKGCKPIIAVASMGSRGAKSKKLSKNAWQHPATEIIKWLGGAHRVYHTFLHERKFDWNDLVTKADHEAMQELSHIVIETDGVWFRIVEVPVGNESQGLPTISQTQRGNGTRWIRAE